MRIVLILGLVALLGGSTHLAFWMVASRLPEPLLVGGAAFALAGLSGFAVALSRKEPSPLLCLALIATALLGPFGILGALIAWLTKTLIPAQKQDFLSWYDDLVPPKDAGDSSHLLRLISVRKAVRSGASTVAPFQDVLALGDVEQKRALMTLVSDHFRPDFAPILQRALRDDEPSIRVLAATTAARIERDVLERSLALEGQGGAGSNRPDDAIALAALYEMHAGSGLVEGARGGELRRKALELYESTGTVEQEKPVIATRSAALMLELDDPRGVVDRLHPLYVAGSLPPDSLPILLEALFRLKDFTRLRTICSDVTRTPPAGESDPARFALLRPWIEASASRQRA